MKTQVIAIAGMLTVLSFGMAGCAEQPPQPPIPTTLSYQLPVITPAEGTTFLQKQGGVTAQVTPISYSPRVRYRVSLQLDPHVGQDILASVGGQNVTTYDATFTPFVTVEPNGLAVTLTITNDSAAGDVDTSSPLTQFIGFLNGHKEEDFLLPAFAGSIPSNASKSNIVAFPPTMYGEDISKPGELRLLVHGVQVIPNASGVPTRSYNFEWRMRFATQSMQLVTSTVTKQIQLSDGQVTALKGAVVNSTDIGNGAATRQ